MWSLTEPELRANADAVWTGLMRGDIVAIARHGAHQVVAGKVKVLPTSQLAWNDYVADADDRLEVYARVAYRDERIALSNGSEVVYLVPIGILAPVGATQEQVDEWVRSTSDDWTVGATNAMVENLEPEHGGGRPIIKVKL